METGAILEDECESFEYEGTLALCCGSTAAQTAALNNQTSLTSQMTSQAATEFGNASTVYNDLVNSLSPTVAAGPNQQGFSAAETSAMNSQAITNAGASYKNAKAATGDALASQSGGNNAATTTGTTAGIDANLASSAANNTANQLNQITQENYTAGRQNYDAAVSGLSGAANVFNPANSAGNDANAAAEGESNEANSIAASNTSVLQAVTGALGAVAGQAAGKIPFSSASSPTNLPNFYAGVANGNAQVMSTSDDFSNSLIGGE